MMHLFNVDLTGSVLPGLLIQLALACLSMQMLSAQQTNKQVANTHINELRNGTLVFIIPSYGQKIEVLQDLLLQNDLSEKERKRTEKVLQRTQSEQDSFATALRHAVDLEYHFSAYAFEKADSTPLHNNTEGLQQPFYYVKRGTTESGADALLIMDDSGNTLEKPFPYYVRLVKVSAIFDSFFGVAEYEWKDLSKVINKMNRNLHKFYGIKPE